MVYVYKEIPQKTKTWNINVHNNMKISEIPCWVKEVINYMISFPWNYRTGKTNSDSRSVVAWNLGWKIVTKGAQGNFGDDKNIYYLDYRGYIVVYICPILHIKSMHFILCELYLNL